MLTAKSRSKIRTLAAGAGATLLAAIATGCSTDFPEAPFPPASERQRLCTPARSAGSIPERPFGGGGGAGTITFNELRDSVNSACMSCHRAPSRTGGFTYVDAYRGGEMTIGGRTAVYEGFFEAAEKMADSIFHGEAKKRMPPEDRRRRNPEFFIKIGEDLRAWIAAGKPEGAFARKEGGGRAGPTLPAGLTRSSDLGECIPAPEAIGHDYRRDRQFAEMEKLPQTLAETDLFTLDPYVLASRGTVAYNVEYPLWADNADKGRWIHVPARVEGKKLVRQTIQLDPKTREFVLPENTRFYKTFYKLVKQKDGTTRARRVETRIIVVRYPKDPQDPDSLSRTLFGAYKWDESEQIATLVETPYRDGSTFKDTIFELVTDEKKGKVAKYAIPGRHRCTECHMGSPTRNAVLGLTPLQLNRRKHGEGGREAPTSDSELTQADRFVRYGITSGYLDAEELPKLEWVGSRNPRNIYELRAQGYFVGNCAHCHNFNGYAFKPDGGVTLNLSAGEIYEFNTYSRSMQRTTRELVHHGGDPERSHIYLKVADPPEQQGLTSRMPMHTPGAPDCNALRIIGKWIKSWESIEAARTWEPECKQKDIPWVDQDFTWPKSDHYVPRRDDWKDAENGMPARYRELVFTPELEVAVRKEVAVGYFNKKEDCRFPEVNLPPEKRRPWMLIGGKPKRPFGEVYATTPGAWYYRTTCAKCHGIQADGNSALASGILNWSGGSVRVANFMEGMFGNKGANLGTFDFTEGGRPRNLGGNYLIWMAMEGTRVQFPSEASNFTGKHGAQMLNQVRDKCLRQISPEKSSSPNFPDHEIFREICFVNNLSPGHPDLAFDRKTSLPVNPAAVERWLDRAAFNGGWAIHDYLLEASRGQWRVGNDECEKAYPAN